MKSSSGVGRTEAVAASEVVERGTVVFLYRPRVERHEPEELGDVQRLLVLLDPHDSEFERLIVIGRKRLPPSRKGARFWGFVDLYLAPYDMNAALGAHVYGTKTRGLRHLPAAQRFASGSYEIVTHGPHSHLRWWVEQIDDDDPIARELDIERQCDYIVSVANPDPTAWDLTVLPDLQSELFDDLELHVTIPTPFPPPLQDRFRGRRYAPLDSPEWLDHPGAELVFVGAGG